MGVILDRWKLKKSITSSFDQDQYSCTSNGLKIQHLPW